MPGFVQEGFTISDLQCFASKKKFQDCINKNPDREHICDHLKIIFDECIKDANISPPQNFHRRIRTSNDL